MIKGKCPVCNSSLRRKVEINGKLIRFTCNKCGFTNNKDIKEVNFCNRELV